MAMVDRERVRAESRYLWRFTRPLHGKYHEQRTVRRVIRRGWATQFVGGSCIDGQRGGEYTLRAGDLHPAKSCMAGRDDTRGHDDEREYCKHRGPRTPLSSARHALPPGKL